MPDGSEVHVGDGERLGEVGGWGYAESRISRLQSQAWIQKERETAYLALVVRAGRTFEGPLDLPFSIQKPISEFHLEKLKNE